MMYISCPFYDYVRSLVPVKLIFFSVTEGLGCAVGMVTRYGLTVHGSNYVGGTIFPSCPTGRASYQSAVEYDSS